MRHADAYEGWHALTRTDLVATRWMATGLLIADRMARP